MFGFADFYFVHECTVVQAQKENELACSEGTKALFSHFLSFSFSYLLSVCLCFSLCFGIPDHLTCLLRNLYAGQEATVRTGHGTTDWFQTGKGYIKAVYCHTAYLTYMQSTSCEMPGWMKHKLESCGILEYCWKKYQ